MALDEPFTTLSPVNVNFDIQDFLEGTVTTVFSGFNTDDSAGVDYGLSRSTIRSSGGGTTATTTSSGAAVKLADIDFDTLINSDQVMLGLQTFMISIFAQGSTGGSATGYCIIKLRKWDGTTETEIGSVQTDSKGGAAATLASSMETVSIDVTSDVRFNRGDTLRVTVEVWGSQVAGAPFNGFVGFAHDPENRAFANILETDDDSKFESYIKWKLLE